MFDPFLVGTICFGVASVFSVMNVLLQWMLYKHSQK